VWIDRSAKWKAGSMSLARWIIAFMKKGKLARITSFILNMQSMWKNEQVL